ncbi:MAG: CRISPR-associated helicase Cas3', partial [Phaeodactylibacter sp.]|nr:CRISPR-associated helicase Cas3' [Phaeodactylibacter sp.]
HRLQLKSGRLAENLSLIKQALEADKKVLVVCNTVDQARAVFEQLKDDHEALLIHGRFAAKDRTRVEKELQNKPPKLLIGTQAIEVSLDIDYDVIYTEPAPLDALIQRFGRVNRKNSKAACLCAVFKERNEKDKYIYDHDMIERTLGVLAEIENEHEGIIQEIDLQAYIDQVYPKYDDVSQEKFNKTYDLLTHSVKRLTPFEPSQEGEEDYYKQFDGVKVLPAYYEKEFKELLDAFDFIGAEQLKVSIRKNWFARLINTPDLNKLTHVLFPSENPKAKAIEIKYFKINKWYRPDTGLNFEKDEDTKFIVDRTIENNKLFL